MALYNRQMVGSDLRAALGLSRTPLSVWKKPAWLVIAILMFATIPSSAPGTEKDVKFEWFGDFRLRLERDWDSQNSAGVSREDRSRARIRARFGVMVRPDNDLSFGFRLRTGTEGSHQSPHSTILDFGRKDTGVIDVNFDKWFVRGQSGDLWGWAGRNSFPFWTQNELFWDEDVTLAGFAGGVKMGSVALNAGYFSLPVGMRAFSGNLRAAQIVYAGCFGRTNLTASLGHFRFHADLGDRAASTLRNANGARDYAIWVGSLQARFDARNRPLRLGMDLMRNVKDYDASEPFGRETDGYVLSAIYGKLEDRDDWLLGYYNVRIEKLAVNSSYAQDDWVRWGSANETDSSDFKGHELRAGYAFHGNFNVVARVYLVKAITSVQDGKRFRVDFNYKF